MDNYSSLFLLRYNTGNDKKIFCKFKNDIDAVIFNATIVAHSGSSIADLVSMHKRQYIIDPQTHIYQHDKQSIERKNKKTGISSIKSSVQKYLNLLPEQLSDILIENKKPVQPSDFSKDIIVELCQRVYEFEMGYVSLFAKNNKYDKYLSFAKIQLTPQILIAPYFMLKKSYNEDTIKNWMSLNHNCILEFQELNKQGNITLAGQLVIDKEVLSGETLNSLIESTYIFENFKLDYLFLWINDFSGFTDDSEALNSFFKLIKQLNHLGIKAIMAYGGYDSILLCHEDVLEENRLFGVAQSVGYGESRPITPVGNGMPTNKYYFPPLHQRMRVPDIISILLSNGYWGEQDTASNQAKRFYKEICDCTICKKVIDSDINNFEKFNEANPFIINGKHGEIKRLIPTSGANLISALHYMNRKVMEWDEIRNQPIEVILHNLLSNYSYYNSSEMIGINNWCNLLCH